MKSDRPKVLHDICGRSLIGHVLHAASALSPEQLVTVVGFQSDQVREHLGAIAPQVRTAYQAEQNGTGHAVRIGLEELGGTVDGTVVVVCGDTPSSRARRCRSSPPCTAATATP